MAVNEFMHPRNRYRHKPNFQELVKLFPELKEVANVDLTGKVKLDYRNRQAVQLLSKCLLLRDFHLKIELPPEKLVPTLPLRLNYIHWLEDIGSIAHWAKKETIHGIDIGCGASCIYPLLAVVQSNKHWHMVAIEKAEDSLQIAKDNVIRNELQACIDVRPQAPEGKTILLDVLEEYPNQKFDFCMCNPPFFDSASVCRDPMNRTGKRREPSNASTGSFEELCTEGGEVQFINQIMQESLFLKDRIAVYTTMIGHKSSYEEILRILKNAGIFNITANRFCQGNTTRWAVAWSFDTTILLSLVPNSQTVKSGNGSPGRKKIVGKPASCKILATDEMHSIQTVWQLLAKMLQSISIVVRVVDGCAKTDEIICEITAQQNTLSHQRRKRRAEQMKCTAQEDAKKDEYSEMGRKEKRPKLEDDMDKIGRKDTGVKVCDPYLKGALSIKRENDGYYLALQYVGGIGGKDAIHQVLQYVKNNIKSKEGI
ncbi:U6 small nuclear RNA (adenine-(43)-N(6))-methyltransferase [Anopheles nili]|uniref:U6 small nuclear RNA (adenine-(43)-N(6))-methyltransferase n=1 Tax=Anopheles nili TaxID=185578 RepID=UPI00237A116D|nr:U6 small nuclear RNA (adenine-(43)-N(6))-methyltransferase [Anopheles nili]